MIIVRKANEEDCLDIYRIRNDERVIEFFFDSRLVSYEEHRSWYFKSLKSNSRILFCIIEEVTGSVIGVVRYDLNPGDINSVEVSIYLSPNHWGKGISGVALNASEEKLKKIWPNIKTIEAKVIFDNKSSISLFKKNGFCESHIVFYKGISK